MMRCGQTIGTLDWETNVIHMMGSEDRKITESVQKEMLELIMQGNGIVSISNENKAVNKSRI